MNIILTERSEMVPVSFKPLSELPDMQRDDLITVLAQTLSTILQMDLGMAPDQRVTWSRQLPGFQARMLKLARLAALELDPDAVTAMADLAVDATEEWLNGPYDGVVPTPRDIALEAISRFNALRYAPLPEGVR